MTNENRLYPTVPNKTAKSALAKLKKGLSLRKIGEELGISNQTVWRIGNRHNIYSVRSTG